MAHIAKHMAPTEMWGSAWRSHTGREIVFLPVGKEVVIQSLGRIGGDVQFDGPAGILNTGDRVTCISRGCPASSGEYIIKRA